MARSKENTKFGETIMRIEKAVPGQSTRVMANTSSTSPYVHYKKNENGTITIKITEYKAIWGITLSEQEIERLWRMLRSTDDMPPRKPGRKKAQTKSSKSVTTTQMKQLEQSLQQITTRDKAKKLIGSVLRTKRDMSGFAAHLDIPMSSNASSKQMMDRLVEGTVGYRLRSAAIRGKQTQKAQESEDVEDVADEEPVSCMPPNKPGGHAWPLKPY